LAVNASAKIQINWHDIRAATLIAWNRAAKSAIDPTIIPAIPPKPALADPLKNSKLP
jgi:hypothetical protein